MCHALCHMTRDVTHSKTLDSRVMFNNALGAINMTNSILRLPAVKIRTGLSRSTIYLRISKNEFPVPISLGGRAVGWIEEEVDDWVAEKIKASREK